MNSKQRVTWLAVAAVLAISIAIWLSSQRNQSGGSEGAALLPGLGRELDTVTQISVRKGGADPAVIVHKTAGAWTIAERGDYPADVAKLRKLLVNLSSAKIVETKTADPKNFAIIGVEDPTQPGAAGSQLEWTTPSGAHSVIIGKAVGEGNFVRRGGENQSYIVEPGIVVDADPHSWIEAKLLDIAVTDIQSLALTSPAGPNYALHRVAAVDKAVAADKAAGPSAFTLDTIPAGRKAADAQSIAPSPSAFSNITAEDVTASADLDFSKPTLVTLTMTDGSVITLTGVVAGDKHWLLVSSDKDKALTAKSTGRAFEIAGYRFDGIFRPLEQLLVPKDPPKPPQAKAGKGSAAPAQ